MLLGGVGGDTFVFTNVKDSAVGAARDVIEDFASKLDHLDLRGIDAKAGVAGDQAFSFIGFADFTGKAGQLHARTIASGVLVEGDVNGDGKADFQLALHGANAIAAGDFIL